MRSRTPVHLILLAGGSGERARSDPGEPPKQFQPVAGRPLLLWCLDAFLAFGRLASVTVAVPEGWHADAAAALATTVPLPLELCPAGVDRTASTWNAAACLARSRAPDEADLVAVHDAVRPFASTALLERLADVAERHGGAVPGLEVADTVVALEEGAEPAPVRYLPRASLRAVQTPQVFRWKPFLLAHRWAHETGASFTDDGGLLAARGRPPALVPGEGGNWKVTSADDLARARRLLGEAW